MGKVLLYNHIDGKFRVVEKESLEEGIWLGKSTYHDAAISDYVLTSRRRIP